jgi:hypothetical protein
MQANSIIIGSILLSEGEKKLLKTFIRVLNAEYQNLFSFSDDYLQATFLVIDIDNPRGIDQYKTYGSFGLGALHQAVAYGSTESLAHYGQTFVLQKPLRSSEVERLLRYCLHQQAKQRMMRKIATSI